jgi:hypothetical protein
MSINPNNHGQAAKYPSIHSDCCDANKQNQVNPGKKGDQVSQSHIYKAKQPGDTNNS